MGSFASASVVSWACDVAWRCGLCTPVLAAQLVQLGERSKAALSTAPPPQDAAPGTDATSGGPSRPAADDDAHSQFVQALAHTVPHVYQQLTRVMRSASVVEDLRAALAGRAWVWVGAATFVRADQVAFASPATLAPYLYSVPSHLSVFAGLLTGAWPGPTLVPVPAALLRPESPGCCPL
jgi:hypothetical protein